MIFKILLMSLYLDLTWERTPSIIIMGEEIIAYLTQDLSWNAEDHIFSLDLHSDVLPHDSVHPLNQSVRYESDGDAVMSIFSLPQISAIIHFRCKRGNPTGDIAARFESGDHLSVHWPGVTRAFVRVRIMAATAPDTMIAMLRDDIEGGHSTSDVEHPETNQSFRPWSDEEDSGADTPGD